MISILIANPFAPHLGLLFISFIAEVCVAIGILMEYKRPLDCHHKITASLVVGGVVLGFLATFFLFIFDEAISSSQQTTIYLQQSKIIALEKRLAPRRLDKDDFVSIVKQLSPFAMIPGTSIRRKAVFIAYWHATAESQVLQDELVEVFKSSGWDTSTSQSISLQDAFAGVQVRAGSQLDATAQSSASFMATALTMFGPTSLLSNDINSGCLNPPYALDAERRGLQITVGEHP